MLPSGVVQPSSRVKAPTTPLSHPSVTSPYCVGQEPLPHSVQLQAWEGAGAPPSRDGEVFVPWLRS